MIFLDKKSQRTKDGNGYLTIKDNPIAVAGVVEYLESELFEGGKDIVVKVYRDYEDLKAIKDTFSNKPIMHTHKWVGSEAKQVDGAISSEIKADDSKKAIIADLTIYNPDLIEAIENGKEIELSPGYDGDFTEEAGRYEGQDYQYRQVITLANHLAVVENGRAGNSLKIQDDKSKLNEVKNMKKNSMTSFMDAMKKFFDEESKEVKTVDGEVEIKDEDTVKVEDSEISEINAILNGEGSDLEKLEAIKKILETKVEDEEVKDEEVKDEDPKEVAGEVVADLEEVKENIEKAVEKFTDEAMKKIERVQDAYDEVSDALGTSFNKKGKSVNDIYTFGYEQLSDSKLDKFMDAKTAFKLASKSVVKKSNFTDANTANSKVNELLGRF